MSEANGAHGVGRLRQVHIRNYKSIAEARVELGPLNVLVGSNGAGKSNFLDALAFVRDCLDDSIELAFRNRGGIAAVRRMSEGHPFHIGLRLVLELPEGGSADYSFEIAAKPRERFRVAKERCVVRGLFVDDVLFEVENGEFTTEIPGIAPRLAPDRLALFAASGIEQFRPVFDYLINMRVYSIAPFRLREYQESDLGDVLKRDGSNAAAVLRRMQDSADGRERFERVEQLMSRAVHGIVGVEHAAVGQQETIRFRQQLGARNPWKFEALNMSDGTLRILGLLLALYQPSRPPVVAIEEPESTVHPAITELLLQVLIDAAEERQVIVTTHSPDLLDVGLLTDEQIRVVISERNRTMIAPLSEFGRDAIRRGLYTLGELHRLNELNPDTKHAEELSQQMNLFGSPFATPVP